MAAMVLNSALAVEMSVHVVRAFVRLRQLILGSRELNRKVGELERRVKGHDRNTWHSSTARAKRARFGPKCAAYDA